MEDRSFINLCRDDMIARLDIDPRIVDVFKNVMKKMQAYFNANGYTSERDYGKFFETYLLDKKFRIAFETTLNPIVGGFYSQSKNKIVINEKRINSNSSYIEKILCHEFIHFLVHGLKKDSDKVYDKVGAFIDEALTDSLACQMYHISSGYVSQVSMLEFANILSGNFNNYSTFLKGGVDARYCSSDWLNFENESNRYQKDFDDAGVIDLVDAIHNRNYINAQRCLINLFILKNNKNLNINDYCSAIEMLESRPAPDRNYISNVIMQLDDKLINNLGVKEPIMRNTLLGKLEELRQLIYIKLCKNFFEYKGKKYYIDGNDHLFRVPCSQTTYYGNGIIQYRTADGIIEVNKSDIKPIDMNAVNKSIKDISRLFTNYINNDLIRLSQAKSLNNLKKVERISIPSMDIKGKKRDFYIYVATCDDEIVVLSENGYYNCGEIDDIDVNLFKGFTSTNPSEAGLYIDMLGNRDKGLVFSIKSSKNINNLIVNRLVDDLEAKLSPDKVEEIVKDYVARNKKIDDNDIVYDALREIATLQINELDEKDRIELEKNISDSYDKFVITMKDGIVDVGHLSNKHIYEGDKEILYSSTGEGLFNGIINGIPTSEIGNGSISIKTFEGEIDFEGRTHRMVLNEIENITGMSINPYGGFYYDNTLGYPRKFLKDKALLMEELSTINKMLSKLFNDGVIELNKYLKMKQEVLAEYNSMIKNVELNNSYYGMTM